MKRIILITALLAIGSLSVSCKNVKSSYTTILSKYTDQPEFETLNSLFAHFEQKLKSRYNTEDMNNAVRLFLDGCEDIGREFYLDKDIANLISEYRKTPVFLRNWNTVQEIEKNPEYIAEVESTKGNTEIEVEEITIADGDDENTNEETESDIILNPYGKLYMCLEFYSKSTSLSACLNNIRMGLDVSPIVMAGGFALVIQDEKNITDATMMSIFLLLYVQQVINAR